MGFFRSSGSYSEEQSPVDPENPQQQKARTSLRTTLRNSRRSSGSGCISRTSSGRSVSASAKTVKVGSGVRTFSSKTMTTDNNSSRSQSMHHSIDRFRATFNGDLSFRSYVSDLDLESAEMTPIGESSYEDELKRIAGFPPQHDTEGTSSELYPSNDFTLGSGELQNCNNSKLSIANNSKQGSLSRSVVDSHMNEDNNSSGDFYDALSVAGASVMMDKSRAENVGRSGTKFVYIVLLITGVIVSVMINLAARKYEYKNFELEFRSLARETADLAETNAEHTFSQLQTLATTVTSEGLLERERLHLHNTQNDTKLQGSWPNVTIPHFDNRIDDFSKSFGAIMLLYVPLVEAKDKEMWEEYANERAPWEATSTESNMGDMDHDDMNQDDMDHDHNDMNHDHNGMNHDDHGGSDRRKMEDSSSGEASVDHSQMNHSHGSHHHGNSDGFLKIHSCAHLDIDDTRERFFDVEAFGNKVLKNYGGFEDPEGLSAPIYQYGGPGHERTHHTYIALMDLMTHPIFKKEVIASIEYDVPVISEYMDVNFLLEGLSTRDPAEDTSVLWNSEYSVYQDHGNSDIDSTLTLPSIRSITLHQVKESFEPDARTIGFVVGVVPWHSFFRNILKTSQLVNEARTSEANGIVVVVVSDCGSVFTFVLNNRDGTSKVRLGDWKEQYEKYQHLNHTSNFFWKDHPQGESRHCHFDLNIYPNEEFRDSYRENTVYYSSIIGGIFLFTALLFACYDHFIFKGQQHIVNEASGMVVQNARRAAKNERDLNDFIAHEVRNPLAAAISACSFVSSAITEDQGQGSEGGEAERLALIASDEKRKEVQDDINIIDSSLHFINDLLRNMLDIQRAGSNQIDIEKKPTNIMDDIFKPVEAMMHLRDAPFKILMEVDSGIIIKDEEEDNQLVVMTDSMRLKQVMLNLVRNATKFVEKGFIRCSASVNPINGFVELRVDDSGPGIPPEKRSRVFGKFQQSLDLLQQGTGIGLSLCKKMITMMGGSLFIDEDYNSGVEGCRGTSFVIQLKIPPLQLNELAFEPEMTSLERARLRRRHLLACTEFSNIDEKPAPQAIEKQTDSICSIMSSSSSSKDVKFEDESETEIRFQEMDCVVTNVTKSSLTKNDEDITKEVEEALDKKEGSDMLPLPTSLQLSPANDQSDVIDDQKEQPGMVMELPKNLSVLFVDDDMILRKLFSRTLRKVNPTWTCKEASSGEMAIELISSNAECKEGFEDEDAEKKMQEGDCGFDLIFMDQYMASVQKQLLGTETVRKIRANGFRKPIICGLSANDVEDAFYHAGSDAFMFKPFPCKKDELEKELLKVINSRVGK